MTAPIDCPLLIVHILDNAAWWLVSWCVLAPVIPTLCVDFYYRIRYRKGIAMQLQFEKGLFK